MARRKHENGVDVMDNREKLMESKQKGRMKKKGKDKDTNIEDGGQMRKGQKRKSEEITTAVKDKKNKQVETTAVKNEKNKQVEKESSALRKQSERGDLMVETKKKSKRRMGKDDVSEVKQEESPQDDAYPCVTKDKRSKVTKTKNTDKQCKKSPSVSEIKCDYEGKTETPDHIRSKNTNLKSQTSLQNNQEFPKRTENGMPHLCLENIDKSDNKAYRVTSTGDVKIDPNIDNEVGIMSNSDDPDFECNEKKYTTSKVSARKEKAHPRKSKSCDLNIKGRRNDDAVSSAKKLKLSEETDNERNSKEKEIKSSENDVKKHSRKPKRKKEMDRKSKHNEKQSEKCKNEKMKVLPSNSDQGDVMSLLLQMEGGSMYQTGYEVRPGMSGVKASRSRGDDSDEMASDEEESDWEEVEDDPSNRSPKKSQIPNEPVQVTIDAPDFIKKRKKKEFDLNAYLKRQMNRFQRELREDMHKVHLMLLLSRGMYLNRVCGDITLQAVTLSIIPLEILRTVPMRFNLSSLERLMNWYAATISMDSSLEVWTDLKLTLVKRLEYKKVASPLEYVLIFVALLRCIGLQTRLVFSLQPLPIKASGKTAGKASTQKKAVTVDPSASQKKSKVMKNMGKKESKDGKGTKGSPKGNKQDKESSNLPCKPKNIKNKLTDKNDSKGKALRKRGSNVKPMNYKLENGSEMEESEEEYTPEEEGSEEENKDRKKKTQSKKTKLSSKKAKISSSRKDESEDDFEETIKEYRTPINKSALMKKSSTNKKILSSDSEVDANEQGVDHWVEVYLENKWICVDCLHKQLNRPYRLESGATQPVHYVVSYFQDGSFKDVTARYASNWMTDTRKLRTDPGWWEETINPYRPLNVKSDQQEDSEIKVSLMKRPMPTSIAAFKSHPLYALRRHLLKYEAIYPDSAAPLGFVRGEPVYARECVHELHSRDNWLKEARAVRVGEKAYKMVKSRAKWNRPKENPDALDLELYGLWQTEEYMPPPAVDGKVPKNEYGNIELFKPCMLPIGTVHLQIPGLNKVAKKLNIDCVPAMVGWDSHCGFSVPLLDGFVVCEEHKETLMAAWEEDQEIQKQREAEKREKRAMNNWKVLIKGLLIKDRLKKRFDLQEQESREDPCDEETKKFANSEKATDAELSWPRKQQEQRAKKGKSSTTTTPKGDNSTSAHYQVETL